MFPVGDGALERGPRYLPPDGPLLPSTSSPLPPVRTLNALEVRDHDVSRLRLAIVSDAELERNGVGTYYADLVDHLRDHVARVELICPGLGSSCGRLAVPMPGDPTQNIWVPRFRQLHQRLIALRPDVVIVPTPGPWGLFGARFAGQFGLAMIVGFHTPFDQIISLYGRRLTGSIAAFLLRVANRYLFHRSAIVLANSRTMVDEARALGAVAVDLIGTPLAPSFLEHASAALAPAVMRVLVAGRLAPEKNVQSVIEAAAVLPNLHFTIVGDGPMRADIATQASRFPNIEMRNWLPRLGLLELLDRTDLLVLPSHVESLGTVALEALARGRTVLASSQCGINEWPTLASATFGFQAGEPLARAIRRVAAVDIAGRRQRAMLGVVGAREMNRRALRGWLEVLAAHGRRGNT